LIVKEKEGESKTKTKSKLVKNSEVDSWRKENKRVSSWI